MLVALISLWQTVKTHKLVNSRMTEMIELTKEAATAEATLVEKDAQSKRVKRVHK